MARRPGGGDDDISLFPFLSIIACVIGVLTLMIATVTMTQMDRKDVAIIEAYETSSAEMAKLQENIARLKKMLEQKFGSAAVRTHREIEASEKELQSLLKQLEQVTNELEKLKETKVVVPTLKPQQRESVASMETQLQSITAEVAQMEKDLSGRKEASQSKFSILPSGSGLDFKPHFIECAGDALVLHDFDPPKTIRAANMVTDKDFLKILETVANGVNDTIVFLIRSDGLNTYYAARKLCSENSIRNGKLPVVGDGKIDLSYFVNAKK
jgi:hypothetical protein